MPVIENPASAEHPADLPWTIGAWGEPSGADLAEVSALARRCLRSDGGLPLAAEPSYLRSRYAAPGGACMLVASREGDIVAAASVRLGPQPDAVTVTGLVDPAWRARGLGSRLLDLALARAQPLAPVRSGVVPVAGRPVEVVGLDGMPRDLGGDVVDGGAARVVVETESWTPDAERLFTARGLRRTFAEDVLRRDLSTALPAVALPAGAAVREWCAERAGRFFAVYESAFRQRPGFPGWPLERWVAWTAEGEGFLPGASLLLDCPGLGGVGFVTCAEGWLIQLGTVPGMRGRGLAAALVVEALRRQRAAGVGEVLLDVAVGNPAVELYRRLGFTHVGRRARFER